MDAHDYPARNQTWPRVRDAIRWTARWAAPDRSRPRRDGSRGLAGAVHYPSLPVRRLLPRPAHHRAATADRTGGAVSIASGTGPAMRVRGMLAAIGRRPPAGVRR